MGRAGIPCSTFLQYITCVFDSHVLHYILWKKVSSLQSRGMDKPSKIEASDDSFEGGLTEMWVSIQRSFLFANKKDLA